MVGESIRKACTKHKLDRSDIFVTTKLGECTSARINLPYTTILIQSLGVIVSLMSIVQNDML